MKSEILARRSIRNKIQSFILRSRLRILFFVLLALLAIVFLIAMLMMSKGVFTVTLPREQMINLGLIISDTPDFARPRHEILSPPVIDIWNITETDIPKDVNLVDGAHNGANYLAMTVYLKNDGDRSLEYRLAMDLNEVYRSVDEALRVKLYINDEPMVYAKTKSDGSGEPEPNTEPFSGLTRIIFSEARPLSPQQVDKFTIVAWVEGEDPDCVNDLLGGFVKMTMSFDAKVVNTSTDAAA